MATRYKVTFFDIEQHMRRTIEVDDPSPVNAIKAALKRLLGQGFVVADFGAVVHVQTMTTTDQWFQLSEVIGGREAQPRVA